MCHLRSLVTRVEARVAVIDYIEAYNNSLRSHSTVGCRVSAELMDELFGRVERALAPEGEVMPLAA